MKEKENFLLYHNQFSLIEDLSEEEIGKLLISIFKYSMNGELPSFKKGSGVSVAFNSIKTSLDINNEKYKEKCMKNTDHINKRWRNIFINNKKYDETSFNNEFPNGYNDMNFETIYNTQKYSSFERGMETFHNTEETREEYNNQFKT